MTTRRDAEGARDELPSRLREGSGVGTVKGVRRPTERAQRLRREATPAERRLWQQLSASKLGVKFSRQMPVGPYICDFLSRGAMLVVELDGDSHAATIPYDARRSRLIKAHGLRIIRFSNADVMSNLEGVVHEIERVLAANPTPDPTRKREGDQACPPPAPPASGRGA